MEMKKHLDKAKKLMNEGGYTCVIMDGPIILSASRLRGVAPLVEFIKSHTGRGGFVIADKVIGKAAALLCVKAHIVMVFAEVLSTSAKEVLSEHGIEYDFGTEVPHIMNRADTGLCPMEQLSEGVDDPHLMFDKILNWLASK